MLLSLCLVIAGLALLILGGELLLRGAVGLATIAKVTPAVIGLTVVAAGTSVPELAVSLIAALGGSDAVAVGNVVGSNIFNIAVILGLAAVIRPLAIAANTVKVEHPVLVAVSILFLVLGHDRLISRLDGVIFVALYISFTAYLVRSVRSTVQLPIAGALEAEAGELQQDTPPAIGATVCWALIAGGVALLAGGAHITVTGAIELGRMLGLSETAIGLTIVAGGTSLPEVVTSLVASVRGRDDIAVGNVIGSNLFNILGVLGLSALVRPMAVPPEIAVSDVWWMLALTVLLFPIIYTGRKISRIEGIILVGIYVVFLVELFQRQAA